MNSATNNMVSGEVPDTRYEVEIHKELLKIY